MSSSKRSRRHFTTEQKVAILKRHMVDKVPVSDLCDEENLQPSVFYTWQRQALENLAGAFSTPAADGPSKREKEASPLGFVGGSRIDMHRIEMNS
jgi:transposase